MIPRYTAPRKRRRGVRRGPARDPRYLAFIRSLPCLVCGRRAEAAHQGPHGISQKASDHSTVPLCTEHHRAQHIFGRLAFDAEYGVDLLEIAARLYREYQQRRAD